MRTHPGPSAPRGAAPRLHRRPLRVGLLTSADAALALLLTPALYHPRLRLLWNASSSVPLGLYRIEPNEPPRVGDLVAVRPSPALGRFMANRRYVEVNALLLKPIAAAGGANVCRIDARVTIDARAVASRPGLPGASLWLLSRSVGKMRPCMSRQSARPGRGSRRRCER